MEEQEIEVMTRTAAAGVEVLRHLDSTRAVCDCMAAIMSGDLIPKPKEGPQGEDGGPALLTPSERLLPLSHPRVSPGSQRPEWVADLLVAVLQRAGLLSSFVSFMSCQCCMHMSTAGHGLILLAMDCR